MKNLSLLVPLSVVSFLFASCSGGGFSGTEQPKKKAVEKCTASPCPPGSDGATKVGADKAVDALGTTNGEPLSQGPGTPGGGTAGGVTAGGGTPGGVTAGAGTAGGGTAGGGTAGGGSNPAFSGNTVDVSKLPDALKEKCAPSKIQVYQTRIVFEPVSFPLCQGSRPRYTEVTEGSQAPFRWNSIVETNKSVDVPKGVTVCGVDFDFYNYQAFYHSDQIILHFNNKILMTTALSAEYSAAGLVNEIFFPYRKDLLEGKLMKTNPTTFEFNACAGLKQGLSLCHFPPTVTRRETIGSDVLSFIPKPGLREKFAQQLGQTEGLSFGLVTGANVAGQACNSGAFFDVKVLYAP